MDVELIDYVVAKVGSASLDFVGGDGGFVVEAVFVGDGSGWRSFGAHCCD